MRYIGAMDASAAVFEAMIVPHRSLSARGMRFLIAAICSVSLFMSALFWWLGAWPIAGFNGIEITLAVVLLRINARAARASELLLLDEGSLRIVRTAPDGTRQERRLPAAWLNVVVQERQGRAPGLWLVGQGRHEEIARSLGEDEKLDLAAALRAALHRLRNPVFDNPQLDEA